MGIGLRAKYLSDKRDVRQSWKLTDGFVDAMIQQPRHCEGLATLNLYLCLRMACRKRRDGESRDSDGVCIIQRAYLGCELQMNRPVRVHRRSELYLDTVGFECN